MRFFSYRDRPVHLGPYPLERLTRADMADLSLLAPMQALSFDDPDPESLKHAMARYIGIFALVRDCSPNRLSSPASGLSEPSRIRSKMPI